MTAEWFPAELAPVAYRLARVDDLIYQIGSLSRSWSRGDGDKGAVALRQVRRPSGQVDVLIGSVRPLPPAVEVYFSEVIHHLRAAIENTLFHLVERERGSALEGIGARKVEFPVSASAVDHEGWEKKVVKHVPELASTHPLGERVRELQPFSSGDYVGVVPEPLRSLMGLADVKINPLMLLRDYSNVDKHRAVHVAAGRAMITDLSSTRSDADRAMRPIEVGQIVQTVDGPSLVELSPAVHVCRPDGETWVPPAPELHELHQYVHTVVIPTLIKGERDTDTYLPPRVDLADTGETFRARLARGSFEWAHVRAKVESTAMWIEAQGKEPIFPPLEDEEEELDRR